MDKKEFTFTFDVTFRPSEKQMYVGKAFITPGGFLEVRVSEGMKTRKVPGKDLLRTKATYTASPGDIIVKRLGGSWQHDEEFWYLVTEDGREVEVANYDDLDSMRQVIRYLKGEISAEELVK